MLIPLTQGKFAEIDDSDAQLITLYKWHYKVSKSNNEYACRNLPRSADGKRRCQRMHQLLLPVKPGMTVDHIDGNGLNNKRSNLRPATKQQQKQNSRRRDGKYKGIQTRFGRFYARIIVNKRHVYLGSFSNEKEAVVAYNKRASIEFGEYANLNKL